MFLLLLVKNQKNLEKTKKTKKKQNCKTHVGTSWWVRVCNFVFFVFFFCFFWFSRCFCYFWSKTKKTSRKPKKTKKKQNCKTHVGTSWWVRVCNFVFFVFLVFSMFLLLFGFIWFIEMVWLWPSGAFNFGNLLNLTRKINWLQKMKNDLIFHFFIIESISFV